MDEPLVGQLSGVLGQLLTGGIGIDSHHLALGLLAQIPEHLSQDFGGQLTAFVQLAKLGRRLLGVIHPGDRVDQLGLGASDSPLGSIVPAEGRPHPAADGLLDSEHVRPPASASARASSAVSLTISSMASVCVRRKSFSVLIDAV